MWSIGLWLLTTVASQKMWSIGLWLLTTVASQKLFEQCDVWAYNDAQCTSSANHAFMWTSCRSSCMEQAAAGIYQTNMRVNREQCERWAQEGECFNNLVFIQTHCPAECGLSAHWNVYVRNSFRADTMVEIIKEGNSRICLQQAPISFKDNAHREMLETYRARISSLKSAAAERRDRRLALKQPRPPNDGKKISDVVSSVIDLESMSVVQNPAKQGKNEQTADLFEVAEEMRSRLRLVTHEGSLDAQEHFFNFDTPGALQGLYGLYEGAYYTLRLYQVTTALLLRGVDEAKQQQLHESLSLMRMQLVTGETRLHEVLTVDGYSGDYISRNLWNVVLMLGEAASELEELLLQSYELPLYRSSDSSFLDVSRLHEGVSTVLSEAGLVPRERIEQVGASKISAPMPKLSFGKRFEGGATVTLSTGVSMPALAFGTWKLDRVACEMGVQEAIETGIRHIDSAEAYMNERFTGNGIQNALGSVPGLIREDLFIATKLSSQDASGGYENTLSLINRQLQQLQVDYLDLYYLHSPFQNREMLLGSLQAIFGMILDGKIRSFGLSNFGPAELDSFFGSVYEEAVRLAVDKATGDASLVKQRSTLFRPVVLQNKYDLYHSGRQFDNQGIDMVAAAQTYSLFLMGYSPFSGYPFALMPLRDPVLEVVSSTYYDAPEAAVWHSLCSSEGEDMACRKPGLLTEKAAVLIQYMLRGESVGIILRSQSRTNLATSIFAASAEMAPIGDTAIQTLRAVQNLLSNPYLKSNQWE